MDGPRRKWYSAAMKSAILNRDLNRFRWQRYIVDSLPSLIYTDFKRLSPYYGFISIGHALLLIVFAVISRGCRIILRYSYIVWMDTESKLPLRVDLLDRDERRWNNFAVIAFNVNQDISSSMQTLAKANLPPLLSVPVGEKAKFSWTPTWLPQGLVPVVDVRYRRWTTCP